MILQNEEKVLIFLKFFTQRTQRHGELGVFSKFRAILRASVWEKIGSVLVNLKLWKVNDVALASLTNLVKSDKIIHIMEKIIISIVKLVRNRGYMLCSWVFYSNA